jgi:CheY-like chemotaxis protein
MARIFLISYDPALARTRELLLRRMGHHVTSAEGFAEAFRVCEEQPSPSFDLMILGHSIPHEDKRAIIKRLAQICPCPVLALTRTNEESVAEADRSVDPMDAVAFLAAVEELLTTD